VYLGKVFIGSFRFLRQNENICDMVLNNSQYYNCNFSPEQLEYIAQNKENQLIITSCSVLSKTSQIFQLGFLLLQLCCLSPLTEIYKLDTLQIYNRLIQSSLEQCSHKYSYRLISLLRNLLQYEPDDRIDLKGVMETVRKVDVKERRIRMMGKEER
jgi:serine/threonine protein kinase